MMDCGCNENKGDGSLDIVCLVTSPLVYRGFTPKGSTTCPKVVLTLWALPPPSKKLAKKSR